MKASYKNLLDFVYPIGAIYMSTTDVNPNTLFGGSWESWAQGKVPVGVDEKDTDFNIAEKSGGEKKHTLTLSEIPSHTHVFTGNAHSHGLNNHTHSIGAHSHGLNSHTHTYAKSNSATGSTTLKVDQIPAHSHTASYDIRKNSTSFADSKSIPVAAGGSIAATNLSVNNTGGSQGHTHSISTTSTNSGAATGNTANSTAFNSGAATGNTANSTQGGTNSNSGGGSAHNNLQPYITCYMWKRIA